jgi:predicted CXXCH cytochrome family protein
MKTSLLARIAMALALALHASSSIAQTDIAKTVHNLTPEGPGTMKETVKTGLCVFCHTPHNGSPIRSMWNKDLPGITYQLYSSSTTRADLKQPTGSSRLCLSCHDGLVALGNLLVPPPGDALKLGPMKGTNVLGSDLSDDHPVSFVYDGALAARHPGIVDPASLPRTLPLDAKQELQCTTCHNAHESKRPKFLRMDNPYGALCITCHQPKGWAQSSHAISPATWKGTGVNPWPPGAAANVTSNACRNCHRTHSAGHGSRLLAWPLETDNCNVCHGGTVAKKDVATEFTNGAKFSRHPVDTVTWTHDPTETAATMARHVACADCHNPHAATDKQALPPTVAGTLQGVSGIAVGGAIVAESSFEYQVCNKCHGFREPSTPGLTRVEATRIVSAKIDPSNKSYHPIAAQGRNSTIQGLIAPMTASSMIGCTDCHNNNDWTSYTGTAPRGPHASIYSPILQRRYETADRTTESQSNYDLCYKCHNRNTLLQSGRFPHSKHVSGERTPCAVCHDAHGSRTNAHLVNFMTRDATGRVVVTPTSGGRLEYITTTPGRGSCYLVCHGKSHSPESY